MRINYTIKKTKQKDQMISRKTFLTFSLIIFLFSFVPVSILTAQLRLPKIIADHMVIQRGQEVKIWGWAAKNEKIVVRLHDQQSEAKANAKGKWEVVLDPMAAGGPFDLEVSGEEETVFRKNILVGDVWVCSGQSNMEMPVEGWGMIKNWEKETREANYPQIRLITVDKDMSFTPRDDLKGGEWVECSPETVGSFSATAYFFGRKANRYP